MYIAIMYDKSENVFERQFGAQDIPIPSSANDPHPNKGVTPQNTPNPQQTHTERITCIFGIVFELHLVITRYRCKESPVSRNIEAVPKVVTMNPSHLQPMSPNTCFLAKLEIITMGNAFNTISKSQYRIATIHIFVRICNFLVRWYTINTDVSSRNAITKRTLKHVPME